MFFLYLPDKETRDRRSYGQTRMCFAGLRSPPDRFVTCLDLHDHPEIAQRLGCSRSAVVSINRKFQVRDYAGHRSTWNVSPAYKQESEVFA